MGGGSFVIDMAPKILAGVGGRGGKGGKGKGGRGKAAAAAKATPPAAKATPPAAKAAAAPMAIPVGKAVWAGAPPGPPNPCSIGWLAAPATLTAQLMQMGGMSSVEVDCDAVGALLGGLPREFCHPESTFTIRTAQPQKGLGKGLPPLPGRWALSINADIAIDRLFIAPGAVPPQPPVGAGPAAGGVPLGPPPLPPIAGMPWPWRSVEVEITDLGCSGFIR